MKRSFSNLVVLSLFTFFIISVITFDINAQIKNIEKKNPRRLIRAIEIVVTTKKPVPELKVNPLPYPVLIIGIKKSKKDRN